MQAGTLQYSIQVYLKMTHINWYISIYYTCTPNNISYTES